MHAEEALMALAERVASEPNQTETDAVLRVWPTVQACLPQAARSWCPPPPAALERPLEELAAIHRAAVQRHGWPSMLQKPETTARTNLTLQDLVAAAALVPGEVAAGRGFTVVSVCVVAQSHRGDSRKSVARQLARDVQQQMCGVALANFRAYTRRHGYGLRFHTRLPPLQGRAVHWGKLLALLAAIRAAPPTAPHLLWMDSDALFLRPERTLNGLRPRGGAQASLTYDSYGPVNSGHMMLRAGAWAERLLSAAWSVYPPPQPTALEEQAALVWLLTGSRPECRAALQPCLARALAGEWGAAVDVRAPRELGAQLAGFAADAFVLHFAGLPAASKAWLMLAHGEALRSAGGAEGLLAVLRRLLRAELSAQTASWARRCEACAALPAGPTMGRLRAQKGCGRGARGRTARAAVAPGGLTWSRSWAVAAALVWAAALARKCVRMQDAPA